MEYEIMFRLAPQKQEGLFQGMNWVHYCCQVCLDAQVSEHSSFISLTAFDTEKDRPSNIAGSHTLSVQISRDSFHVSQVRRQFFFFFFFCERMRFIKEMDETSNKCANLKGFPGTCSPRNILKIRFSVWDFISCVFKAAKREFKNWFFFFLSQEIMKYVFYASRKYCHYV